MKVLPEHPLARKIAVITAIKLVGLVLLWWAFFSGHGNDGVTPDHVSDAILHPSTTHKTE